VAVRLASAASADSGATRVPRALLVSGRTSPTRPRAETVHAGTDDEMLEHVALLGGTEQEVFAEPAMRDMIMPALRADYIAIETYQYRAGDQVQCPIDALIGLADPRTTVAEAAAWAEVTTGQFRLHTYPGDHFFITSQLTAIGELVRAAVLT
jgi:surfactin synthase thioesterase subunit